jgi:hypothetical protein
MTTVSAVTCPKCKWTIFSRAHHDFHWCECQEVAIDGGRDYVKLNFTTEKPPVIRLVINATERELYDDWNQNKGKFGLLPPDAVLNLAPLEEETTDEAE